MCIRNGRRKFAYDIVSRDPQFQYPLIADHLMEYKDPHMVKAVVKGKSNHRNTINHYNYAKCGCNRPALLDNKPRVVLGWEGAHCAGMGRY